MESAISEEMDFFIFLIELYAERKKMSTGDVMRLWDKHNLVPYIMDNYFMYHQEAIENAFADIDSMIETGKPAW